MDKDKGMENSSPLHLIFPISGIAPLLNKFPGRLKEEPSSLKARMRIKGEKFLHNHL
jgi:hypothetical protein